MIRKPPERNNTSVALESCSGDDYLGNPKPSQKFDDDGAHYMDIADMNF